jgi:hypothetical protein
MELDQVFTIATIILFATAGFLLSPQGRPFITTEIVSMQPISGQRNLDIIANNMPSTVTVTELPNGNKIYVVNIYDSIQSVDSLSGEVVHYSYVSRIFHGIHLVELFHMIFYVSGVLLTGRYVLTILDKGQRRFCI